MITFININTLMDLDLGPLPLAVSSEIKRPLDRPNVEEICGLFTRAIQTGQSLMDSYDGATGWSEGPEKLWQR